MRFVDRIQLAKVGKESKLASRHIDAEPGRPSQHICAVYDGLLAAVLRSDLMLSDGG